MTTLPNTATLELLVQIYIYGEVAVESETRQTAIRFLLNTEMVTCGKSKKGETVKCSITAKARFFIDHVLNIPLPVETKSYTIPESDD